MDARTRPVLRAQGVPLAAAVVLAMLVFGGPRASAAVILKTGTTAYTAQANCFPATITPGYSQQTAIANPSLGIEPKVGDVFYLSVRVDTFITFDCAADFFSVLVTLPVGVQPAIFGSAIPICRRFGTNSQGQTVYDTRAAANCPTAVTFDNASRQFPLRPIASPVLPDVGGSAGSYWFMGIRAPQEGQEYPSVQLLVPVKATAAVSAKAISYDVCTVGTSCATASVDLNVTALPPGSLPLVSLPANVTTSQTGARVPFTINAGASPTYYLKVDTATDPGFTTGRPCGLTDPVIYGATPTTPFQGSFSSEVQFGDLQQAGTICNLVPNTTYYVKACTANPGTAYPFADFDCRTTSFTTGGEAKPAPPPAATTTGGTTPGTGTPTTTPTVPGSAPVVTLTATSVFRLPSTRTCLKRPAKLTLAFRKPKGVIVDRVEVWIGKKRLQRLTGVKARRSLTLKRLPSKRFTLILKITPRGGKTIVAKRTYRIC